MKHHVIANGQRECVKESIQKPNLRTEIFYKVQTLIQMLPTNISTTSTSCMWRRSMCAEQIFSYYIYIYLKNYFDFKLPSTYISQWTENNKEMLKGPLGKTELVFKWSTVHDLYLYN